MTEIEEKILKELKEIAKTNRKIVKHLEYEDDEDEDDDMGEMVDMFKGIITGIFGDTETIETMATAYQTMYKDLIKKGFTKEQAFQLLPKMNGMQGMG